VTWDYLDFRIQNQTKIIMRKSYPFVFLILLFCNSILEGQTFQVASLNNEIFLTLKASDSLTWSVAYKKKDVIEMASINLLINDRITPGAHSKHTKDSLSVHKGEICPVVTVKDSRIRDEYKELTLRFDDHSGLEFRVYNDGVAYRFITGIDDTINVTSEKMDLEFPARTTSLFPLEKSMYSHYERAYLLKSLDTIRNKEFCSLPVLFTTLDSIRVLFSEADLFDYPGMFIQGTESDVVKAIFPKYVLETKPGTKGPDRNEIISKEAGYIARTTGKRSFPWRVFIIADDDRVLVESNLIYQLSRPSEIDNTDWIRPGKVAWDWYNANNLAGVDFAAGINTATYKYYIDFASKYGLEYVILDEGWTKSTTDLIESNPEIDIPELVSYGKLKNVGIILWMLWKPLNGNEEKVLRKYHDWGIKGIKVDFMQRADQYMVNSYTKIASVAANQHLLVDFHGAFKPAGLNRAYPNVLSFEGVRGNENNKWSDYSSPEHNVTLPFIRMAAGPMDYTPGAMRNAQKKDFTISFNTPLSQGTRCHQVAMYIIYESPLQMLCDLPSLYYADDPTTSFIAKIPSVWDETRVLEGKVGDYITIARRKGETWYVGAMTDWSPRETEIDLSFLPESEYIMEVMKDGVNAAKNAEDNKKENLSVTRESKIRIHLAPGGGWAAIITKKIPRWHISGNERIEWTIKPGDEHSDHIEMSGERVSLWVQYEIDSLQQLKLSRTVVFPNFRMKPDDTHGTLMAQFTDHDLPRFFVNATPLRPSVISGFMNRGMNETVLTINQGGIMQVTSKLERRKGQDVTDKLFLKRTLMPTVNKPAAIEKLLFINIDDHPIYVAMEYNLKEAQTDTMHSTEGPHKVFMYTINDGVKRLQPGDSAEFAVVYQAVRNRDKLSEIDVDEEFTNRLDRVNAIEGRLQLVTPDPVLNTAFAFAKLRVGESVYNTKNGLINSPGGLRYYAAIWANDQAEYTGPYFGYAGFEPGAEAAMNAYQWFARYMNENYDPIPSSIIAEGTGFWNGAGDRGDQAMIAYGASRFALACGNREMAEKLWPLIEWCLEYCKRKINSDGVVASESDELEGRFPSGSANLCTSSLYYDALVSASLLCKELGKPRVLADSYLKQAGKMRDAINGFFGAKVEGFDTYRYYKENETLRAWICIPLTVDIYDRKEGTTDALFSPRLWTSDGLATQAGDKTFWDRSTLYALRGVFAAGETDKALKFLKQYSTRRLLGEHVPYPVEAYPEGDQKQLSAESGLYCRIYTEGLFGLRPMGLRSFALSPRLPKDWYEMSLKNIHAFGNQFDIEVTRDGNKTVVAINRRGEKPIIKRWDGNAPLQIKFRN
jgi:alpha-glucosidase